MYLVNQNHDILLVLLLFLCLFVWCLEPLLSKMKCNKHKLQAIEEISIIPVLLKRSRCAVICSKSHQLLQISHRRNKSSLLFAFLRLCSLINPSFDASCQTKIWSIQSHTKSTYTFVHNYITCTQNTLQTVACIYFK